MDGLLPAIGTYGRGGLPCPKAPPRGEHEHYQECLRHPRTQVDPKEGAGQQQEAIANHIKPKDGAVAVPELLSAGGPAQQVLRTESLGQALSSHRSDLGDRELAQIGPRCAEFLGKLARPSALFREGMSLLVG